MLDLRLCSHCFFLCDHVSSICSRVLFSACADVCRSVNVVQCAALCEA